MGKKPIFPLIKCYKFNHIFVMSLNIVISSRKKSNLQSFMVRNIGFNIYLYYFCIKFSFSMIFNLMSKGQDRTFIKAIRLIISFYQNILRQIMPNRKAILITNNHIYH
jgi:hypothetical protein